MTWCDVSMIPQLCLGHWHLDLCDPLMNADQRVSLCQTSGLLHGGEKTGAVSQLCDFDRPSWVTAQPVITQKRKKKTPLLGVKLFSKSAQAFVAKCKSRKATYRKQGWRIGSRYYCLTWGQQFWWQIFHRSFMSGKGEKQYFQPLVFLPLSPFFTWLFILSEHLALLIFPEGGGSYWFCHFLNRKSWGRENYSCYSKLGGRGAHWAILKILPRCPAPLGTRH